MSDTFTGGTGKRRLSGRGLSGFTRGATGAQGSVDLSDGLYEDPREAVRAAAQAVTDDPPSMPRDHHGGMNPFKAFTSKGSVGKNFNAEGSAGAAAEKAGGPLDREGAVGKQFTKDGAVGGTVDSILGEKKK